jgi:hypothetical protein
MLGSGIVVGQAAASGIVGGVASATSAHVVSFAPVIAALIVLTAAAVNWPLSRSERGPRLSGPTAG